MTSPALAAPLLLQLLPRRAASSSALARPRARPSPPSAAAGNRLSPAARAAPASRWRRSHHRSDVRYLPTASRNQCEWSGQRRMSQARHQSLLAHCATARRSRASASLPIALSPTGCQPRPLGQCLDACVRNGCSHLVALTSRAFGWLTTRLVWAPQKGLPTQDFLPLCFVDLVSSTLCRRRLLLLPAARRRFAAAATSAAAAGGRRHSAAAGPPPPLISPTEARPRAEGGKSLSGKNCYRCTDRNLIRYQCKD